jgi:hypothetical protein
MKHPANPQEKQHKNHVFRSSMAAFSFSAAFALPGLFEYPYILLIAIISSAVLACIILTVLVRRRKRKRKTISESSAQENLPKAKPKGLAVTKFELADNTVKFFVAKGVRKKRWVVVKEIPVYEIAGIEHFGNELSVTWKGVTDLFFMKKNAESFGKLCDEVKGMLEEQRKTLENSEKDSLRRSDLTGVINASIGIVDLSFDILMGLQEKRVNWKRLEGYSSGLGEKLSFNGQTMAPLNVDFSKISLTIKKQVAKEASREAYGILKLIYGYFDGLSLYDDLKEACPNFQNARGVILAYYTLNDMLLGRVVGEKDNKKESLSLETVLQSLANETNVKVNAEELKGSIDRMGVESDRESVIEDARAIFKEQLKLL